LVMPQEVFGDAASIRQPVLWALVHAAFVAAASVAQVTFWKFAETAQDLAAQADRRAAAEAEASAARRAVEQAELAQTRAAQLAERQALARHVDEQVRVLSDASSSVNDSVQSVAAIVEQMTANIRAIATHVTDATDAARTAERRADATNVEIAQLGERSEQIGRVITLISSLAAQTHLLALNATIEAARAGDAGRGFAVVANEVKDLAHESAGAAQEIAEMVSAIQDGTRGAAHGMLEIGQVVARIGDLQSVISGAVQEHTATTSEISRKLGSAAAGTEAIAASISELAETSNPPRR
jgi:methyl-accepting chemotaxis protein